MTGRMGMRMERKMQLITIKRRTDSGVNRMPGTRDSGEQITLTVVDVLLDVGAGGGFDLDASGVWFVRLIHS